MIQIRKLNSVIKMKMMTLKKICQVIFIWIISSNNNFKENNNNNKIIIKMNNNSIKDNNIILIITILTKKAIIIIITIIKEEVISINHNKLFYLIQKQMKCIRVEDNNLNNNLHNIIKSLEDL